MTRRILAPILLVAAGMASSGALMAKVPDLGAATSVQPERERHLVLNGDFELVSAANPTLPQGWTWGKWQGNTAEGQLDAAVAHGGKSSFRLRNQKPVSGTFGWLTQLLPTLAPNTEYELSFWAKAEENVGGWVALEITEPYRKTSRRELILSGAGRRAAEGATYDWRKFSLVFNTGEDLDWTILICADGMIKDLWVDDIALTKVSPAPPAARRTAKPTHGSGDAVNVKDFGAIGDRVTDDTAAIQTALDSLGAAGGTVLLGNGRYLTGTIVIPENVGLVGDQQSPELQYDMVKQVCDYYQLGSQLCLKPGCSVLMRQCSSLQNCLVIRAGLPLLATNDEEAGKLVAAFSGRGIIANESMTLIRNCLILGFDLGICSTGMSGYQSANGGKGRMIIERCRIDANNGIDWYHSGDVSHLDTVHCWGCLTATVPGVTGKNLIRKGTGIRLRRHEWTQLTNCFCWGFQTDFACEDSSAVAFLHCQADHGAPNEGTVGFAITGSSELISMLGCTTITQQTGVLVDMTGRAGGFQNNLRIESCVFANALGIDVRKGSLIAVGNSFVRAAAIQTGPEADPPIIIGNLFDECATPLALDSKTLPKANVLGNNLRNCKSPLGAIFNAPVVYPRFTVAELPTAASAGPGATVFVTDAPDGPGLAVSDGTNWTMLARSGILPAPKPGPGPERQP